MNSIVLRIRDDTEPRANESGEIDKSSRLVLELLDASGTIQARERIPADLKVSSHSDDYTTYREFFLEQENQHRKFSEIGRHLFDVLHLGEVGRKWDDLERTEFLRVLLKIETSATGNSNVALLPWELIFDGTQRRFQELDTPIVRIHNYKDEEPSLVERINWPIRLLIVVGVNDSAIAASEEVERIEDALREVNRLIDVEVMEPPLTIDDLEEKCKRFKPHIFHYIGHGGVDLEGNSHVRLRGPSGADDPWSASDIKISLPAWGWIPRFAFINACRTSGRATTRDQLAAWGISDAFNWLRVPAVLTMQANIDGKLAGTFAGTLYEQLALGNCIDRALTIARVKLRNQTTAIVKDNKRDWATPTLTISLPPEKILPLEVQTSKRRNKEIKDCVKFREVDILANCKDERRKFIYGFYPIRSSESERNLVLVRGCKESGKTWVTLWCLEACALLAHNVRHVEVVSGENLKWLDVLREIQAGDATKAVVNKVIYAPLEEEAFYEFNHDLHYRIRGETPPRWDQTAFPFEKDLDLKELNNLSRDTVQNIFTSFRKALRKAAEPNNPLIIVLDQWSYKGHGIAAGHMEEYLIPYLFTQVADGEFKSQDGRHLVKFVLVMNDNELEELYPDLLDRVAFHEVHLQGIPGEHFEKVAKEFFRNLRKADRLGISKSARTLIDRYPDLFIEEFRQDVHDVWQPILLGRMLYAAERFHKARIGRP